MSFVEVVSPIEDIIDDARNGRMFILVDDEDRENEGDLIIPAQMATPDAINFMAKHGRGLICLALTKQRVEELDLKLMSQANASRLQTAFTVSIEAKDGVTTGISASGSRAHRLRLVIDPTKGRGRYRDSWPCLSAGGTRGRRSRPHRAHRRRRSWISRGSPG